MQQAEKRRAGTLGTVSLLVTGGAIAVLSGLVDLPRAPWAPPSGAEMPVGDTGEWRQTFIDDFSGDAIDPGKWGRYSGEPGSDPGAQWSPSRVSVGDGLLTLTTAREDGKWTSGGVNNARAFAPEAGKVEVRMRADHAPGVNVVALLWPEDNEWPPEIDFVEDRDGDRENFTASLHYSDDDGEHRQIDERRDLDMTEWHTYGTEWRGDTVVYTVDGREWARTESRRVPSVPMAVAVQSNVVTKGKVTVGPDTPEHSEVEVDWVVGYVPQDDADDS